MCNTLIRGIRVHELFRPNAAGGSIFFCIQCICFFRADLAEGDRAGALVGFEGDPTVVLLVVHRHAVDLLGAFVEQGGLGDVKIKKFLTKIMQEELAPIRARRKEYEKDIPAVYEILRKGSEAARAVAAETLSDVKRAMKIDYFADSELMKAQSEKYRG